MGKLLRSNVLLLRPNNFRFRARLRCADKAYLYKTLIRAKSFGVRPVFTAAVAGVLRILFRSPGSAESGYRHAPLRFAGSVPGQCPYPLVWS
jgi:hypothetical protein